MEELQARLLASQIRQEAIHDEIRMFGSVLVSRASPDKKAVQCNYREETSECVRSARAYVVAIDFRGNRVHRVRVFARSRSGRWITKWENIRRLQTFRYKTIPPEHPMYGRLVRTELVDETVRFLNAESERLSN